ncbi:histone acetyltransferase subunit NuA4-domain-containing protein [Xylariomycetidae sp. FL0641]|nr:histone acetyltransferase subunit NuA4-domain-containing protein [Xylariomycetidae sp. FL0641]
MSENIQPAAAPGAGGSGDQPGLAHYEQQRAYLKELLQNKREIERKLAMQEKTILQKEAEYLESTPYGNIITGFDGYIKGSSSAAAQRKRTGQLDQNKVFSRSSLSYNSLNPDHTEAASAGSTPAAPTPISTSFAKEKDGGSNHPTPSSATDKKAPSTSSKKKKQKKEAAAAADAGADDSETDSREAKKVRTHFGASRK